MMGNKGNCFFFETGVSAGLLTCLREVGKGSPFLFFFFLTNYSVASKFYKAKKKKKKKKKSFAPPHTHQPPKTKKLTPVK